MRRKQREKNMISWVKGRHSSEQINKITALLIATVIALATFVMSTHSVTAANIYDAQILQRMKFSGAQRTKVRRIIRQSDKEIAVVFRKHGINPNAKPDFDKLRKASTELQAIESREKKKMKKILSANQYKTYLALLQATAARVVKATRTKP